MLLFHVGGFVLLYVAAALLERVLPFNPQGMRRSPDLSLNTAVSFLTNTNWQAYGGESTMAYLVADVGPAPPELPAAATGIVLAMALIRGFAARRRHGDR